MMTKVRDSFGTDDWNPTFIQFIDYFSRKKWQV